LELFGAAAVVEDAEDDSLRDRDSERENIVRDMRIEEREEHRGNAN
jgi:hypothetical protein